MEKITSHEVKKMELIEALAVQVKSTRELLEFSKEFSRLSAVDAVVALTAAEDQILGQFPDSTQAKYREWQSLVDARRDDVDITEADIAYESEVLADPDVLYVKTIIQGIQDLRQRVEESLVNEWPREVSDHFASDDVVAIDHDGLSRVYIVKDSAWPADVGRAEGYFQSGTNSIFIRESSYRNPDEYAVTREHERLHNLLAGFTGFAGFDPATSITRLVKRIEDAHRSGVTFLAESAIDRLLQPQFISDLFDRCHNELITYAFTETDSALDQASIAEFWDDLINEPDKLVEGPAPTPSVESISRLSTAGQELLETISVLKKIPTTLRALGLTNAAEQTESFSGQFEMMALNLIALTRAQAGKASLYGPEAEADRVALMYLLKPSRYRHIDTYLDAIYGSRQD
jgi:hypothetical protein